MSERFYTREHEWIVVAGDAGTVGISQYAQEHLGDVVFVELPDPGTPVTWDKDFAVVESVKAASDVFAPVSGKIAECNSELAEHPEFVNQDPLGTGWFVRITISDPSELETLMDEDAYKAYTSGLE